MADRKRKATFVSAEKDITPCSEESSIAATYKASAPALPFTSLFALPIVHAKALGSSCRYISFLLAHRHVDIPNEQQNNATSKLGDDKQTSLPGDSGCTENPPKHQSIFKLILSSSGKTPTPKKKKRKHTATENQSHNICITGRNQSSGDGLEAENILKFLESFTYTLTSESGAEYSYYTARGNIKQDCGYSFLGDFKMHLSKEKVQQVFNLEMISPAPPTQIQREMPFSSWTDIVETPQLYHGVTKPHITSVIDGGALAWIQNVIHLKKEKERILHNTDEHGGWILNIDTKWKSHPDPFTVPRSEWFGHGCTSDLYCLAIVKLADMASLRDVRSKHVPLLKAIKNKGTHVIKTVYGVPPNKVRVFVHYVPQFFHFHVHFVRIERETQGQLERRHFLHDIIANVGRNDKYYEKLTMKYSLRSINTLACLMIQK
jgi:m7GpppX diphosphatase